MDADNTDPDESWGEDAHIPDDAAPEQDELTEEADDVTGVEEGGFDDIELAYREAMKSIDDAELQVGSALMELAEDDDPQEAEESAFTSIGDSLARDLEEEAAEDREADAQESRISPRSVVEAALFVGGEVSLTARRLAGLIGHDTDARFAVRLIDQLNEEYAEENRPYEIRLHEGGFRMELRENFADVQAGVFGLGPRDVRLSPDALEVLAWVAYNQPVTKADLEGLSQERPLTMVRQLVRLLLVETEQVGKRKSDVVYRTGDRFLKLFNLSSIEDLPQADVFSFR